MFEKYLEHIAQRKPINWNVFWRSIPIPDKSESDFALEKFDSRGRYIVSFRTNEVRQKYCVVSAVSERATAALRGDSHSNKVSFASFTTYDPTEGTYGVSVFSEVGSIQSSVHHKKVLIIENKELFFFLEHLPRLLELHGIAPLDTALILGNGNEITNSLFNGYFSSMDEIHCMFDYDYGGLKIFDTLSKRHGGKVKFSTPLELKPLGHYFKAKPSKDKFAKAVGLADKHNLTELKNLFLQTSRTMEQESLLELIG
ncbi:hypothetical protein [Vibrio crassostreae]|uniref:hypothetical protein n=1 Tax=Vibrio crassostreae TaxID=246167 RepID=UPI001B310371|nr:hypothetical protein [Vibrio crassostreae]